MSLSRAESFRKIPRISFVRWLVVIAGFLLFVVVTFVLYVRSADYDHHHAEKVAIRIAMNQAGLSDVDKATMHTWDETVWIVSGKDDAGDDYMVWERQAEIVKLKVADNTSEDQMRSMFKDEHGGSPIRIVPGWYRDQPIWEVRYWSTVGKRHQAIDFYAFKDGSRIITYDLPVQQ